jgi:hypothetical protein
MAQVASSSSEESTSSITSVPLSLTDCLTGAPVLLALVADGKLQTPTQLRAQIMRPLQLMQAAARLFAQRLHRRQAALPPLGSIFVEYGACGRVRLMLLSVATACRRLATVRAGVHVMYRTTGCWSRWIMERVTRGRVKKVQVLLQRRAFCAVRSLVVPVLACALCLTRAAGNGGWF